MVSDVGENPVSPSGTGLHIIRATLIMCKGRCMPNLTLTIDEETLRRARIRALEQGTSVNAVVREFLQRFAEDESQRTALREFLELAETSEASSGQGGRAWHREDLYAG